jgi:hypothetical protein
MSLKRISQLPNFLGVDAVNGGTATLDLPRGPRYHVIWLRISNSAHALPAAILDEIRIRVNGKVQRIMTPAQLDGLNGRMEDPAYYVLTQDGNSKAITQARSLVTPGNGFYSQYQDASYVTFLPIFLSEPWRPQNIQEQLAWGTGNVASLQLEVDIKANMTGVTLSAFAEMDNAVLTTNGVASALPMGLITKWDLIQVPVTSTKVQWQGLSLPRGDVLLSLHFWDSYVTNMQLLADSYEWRNVSKGDNDAVLVSRRMTTAAACADLVLDYDDIPGGAGLNLDNIQDLRINLDLSDGTARTIPVTVQSLGAPN